jgi:N-acetylglucosamine-6-phosphate deacetylase
MLSRTQSILLIPDRVFDGESFLDGWQVLVQGTLIKEIKPVISVDKGTTILKLPGTTLMPGMIEPFTYFVTS